MVLSRMFCDRFVVALSDKPMLEKVVLQLTEEVRVDCVKVCGLYKLLRLLRSKVYAGSKRAVWIRFRILSMVPLNLKALLFGVVW